MRFLLDENMPFSVMRFLESKGYNVEHVRDSVLCGSEDKKIAKYAKEKEAISITKDIEFGSIILYSEKAHYGLLVLRLPYFFTGKQITNVFRKFLEEIDIERLIGKRTVLELGKYRMREL